MIRNELKKIAPITLQQQLRESLLNDIHHQKYKAGDKIPTEFELSEIYQVSRVTVRAAIKQLVDENILTRKVGKGTFVQKTPYSENPNKCGSFTENCLSHNAEPSTVIVKHRILSSGDKFSDISKGEDILEITRIRYVDKTPCIVEVDYFPESFKFLLAPAINGKSFLKAIAKERNIFAEEFIDKFTIVYSSKVFSEYLHCAIRTPLLKVMQTVIDKKGNTIYRNDQYILTTKYVYVKK